VHAAVTHVHAVDNGIAQRTTALDDSPAHGRDVGIDATSGQVQRRQLNALAHANAVVAVAASGPVV
jgi:hypothetical protein